MSHIFRSYPSKLSAECQLIRGSEVSTVSCWVITNNLARNSSGKNLWYKSLVLQFQDCKVCKTRLIKQQPSTKRNGL